MISLSPLLSQSATAGRICILFCIDDDGPGGGTDSFCQLYERVIRAPEDVIALKKAGGELTRRTAKNDTKYRCLCEGWQNPICMQPQRR